MALASSGLCSFDSAACKTPTEVKVATNDRLAVARFIPSDHVLGAAVYVTGVDHRPNSMPSSMLGLV